MHNALWLFPKLGAVVFAVAGFYFFLDAGPLSRLLGDWVTGRNANRRVEVLIFNRDGSADGPR